MKSRRLNHLTMLAVKNLFKISGPDFTKLCLRAELCGSVASLNQQQTKISFEKTKKRNSPILFLSGWNFGMKFSEFM